MRGKHVFLSGLVVAVLSLGNAHGQDQPSDPLTGRYSPPTPYPGGPDEQPPPGLGPTPYTSGTPVGELPASGGQLIPHESNPLPQYAGSQLPGAVPPPLDPSAPVPESYATQMDPWLVYPRWPGCCCRVGGCGPLGYEIYLRTGFAFPVGGGVFNQTLNTGWSIQGGARTLFFNPAQTSAWTLDLGILNINNNSTYAGPPNVLLQNFPVREPATGFSPASTTIVPALPVTVSDLNQTYASGSVGKEWYLIGCGDCSRQACNWRVGAEVGGRYGSGKVGFNEIQHLTGPLYGCFGAIHSDIEVPCGCCIFYGGIRAEYGSTWDNLLQKQNNGNIQYINLMFTLGTRF